MKAAVLYNPGGWDSFILEEREIPVPDLGWVLVKVHAFGLNRSELMTRKGFSPNVKFPRVLGIECVGEVVDDPSGRLQAGQKVAAFMGGMGRDFDGSYAEFTVLPESLLYPFDSILEWEQLGAIPEMFQTVYGSLHLGLQIKAGGTLLVRGEIIHLLLDFLRILKCVYIDWKRPFWFDLRRGRPRRIKVEPIKF